MDGVRPAPRSEYVIGKLLGLWSNLCVTAIFIHGLVAYWWLHKGIPPYRFVSPRGPFAGPFPRVPTGFLGSLARRRGIVALLALFVLILLQVPASAVWDNWDRLTPSGLIEGDPGE